MTDRAGFRRWMAAAAAAWSATCAVPAPASEPAPVVDDLGRQVALAAAPQRIVSLAPSNTELLFALGLGRVVVGVTDFCNFPPEAAAIEKVADYSTLNAEKVAAVRPDLVVAARGNDLEGLETIRRLEIPVFALAVSSVADVVEAARRLGRLTGRQAEGDSLAAELVQRVVAVEHRVEGRPRPVVLWAYVGDPIYTAGAGSLIDDVIRVAGGRNAGSRAEGAWPQVSLETVVAWSPDVLLTTLQGGADAQVVAAEIARLRGLDGWRELPAVDRGRVVHVDGDLLTRAGPRIVDAVEQLAAALHPDAAGGP